MYNLQSTQYLSWGFRDVANQEYDNIFVEGLTQNFDVQALLCRSDWVRVGSGTFIGSRVVTGRRTDLYCFRPWPTIAMIQMLMYQLRPR